MNRGDGTNTHPNPQVPTLFPACKHIAIIMDGNGRWAKQRGFGRAWGHRQGAQRADEIVTTCTRLAIPYLTLYTFSSENWDRPSSEVQMLMRLLVQQLKRMDKKLVRNGVSLVIRGEWERLPEYARVELKRVIQMTATDSPKLVLTLCLSYGGRQEIVSAVRKIAGQVQKGLLAPEAIDESVVSAAFEPAKIPDPDLLIRTGGDHRISNFLLWQIAYTELYMTPLLWPDFGEEALRAALSEYSGRQRRFGKTSEQVLAGPTWGALS